MMRLLSKTFRSIKPPNLRASKPSTGSTPPPSSPPLKLPISKTSKASPSSRSRSWSVYLILSTNTPIKTYVGSTNNFSRRLKQHNGELRGGAKASRAGRPWVCACLVRGFHDQSEGDFSIASEQFDPACQFETKWKTLSRKAPWKRNNDGDRSLPLLQHRRAALKKVEGLLECSHLDIEWHLNPF